MEMREVEGGYAGDESKVGVGGEEGDVGGGGDGGDAVQAGSGLDSFSGADICSGQDSGNRFLRHLTQKCNL